jgi:hypothetical protein
VRLRRPVRTRFRYGFPTRVNLATQRKLAGSFFKRHAVTAASKLTTTLPRLVGTRFQVLFHSPPGVLFIFPSRYLSAIGHQGVFRLRGWSPQIHTEFHGLRATWDGSGRCGRFRLQGSYLLWRAFPCASTSAALCHSLQGRQTLLDVPQPRVRNPCRVSRALGLASSAFARHYSRNRGCFLFLRVMRCFTSPRSLLTPYVFRRG